LQPDDVRRHTRRVIQRNHHASGDARGEVGEHVLFEEQRKRKEPLIADQPGQDAVVTQAVGQRVFQPEIEITAGEDTGIRRH